MLTYMSDAGTGPARLAAMDPPAPANLDAFLAGAERRAFRMAEIATRDRDEALDIVQDAMLQLARRYASRPPQEWAPLFYRILENKIRDWQRRQTLRRKIFFWQDLKTEDDESAADPIQQIADARQPDSATLVQNEQTIKALELALGRLPARQRQAFELRIWEGMSVEETAVVMGCSDGSVKTHLSRALHSLRAQLEGVWP